MKGRTHRMEVDPTDGGENSGQKALHVAGPPTVEARRVLGQLERRPSPVLARNRHHVRVP
ncbi:hypothetical protein D3C87_1766740 [compost metagenome]